MFKNPFSFEGRIRRTEYGLSIIITNIVTLIPRFMLGQNNVSSGAVAVMLIVLIPVLWFGLAQGVKRCHDRGNSGWFMLIPFYGFVLLFGESDYGPNEFGPNPKGLGNDDPDPLQEAF